MYKRFESISKGDLKKYNGFKCEVKYIGGLILKGEIYAENNSIYILHNIIQANGNNKQTLNIQPKNLKGYNYFWCVYENKDNDNKINYYPYEYIEIDIPEEETKEEFIPGEKVIVSNYEIENIEKAIQNFKRDNYECYYIGENKEGKYVTEDNRGDIIAWKYIAKIPQVKQMTKEEIEKELGYKIDIIG